jgi:hypothetical protein
VAPEASAVRAGRAVLVAREASVVRADRAVLVAPTDLLNVHPERNVKAAPLAT